MVNYILFLLKGSISAEQSILAGTYNISYKIEIASVPAMLKICKKTFFKFSLRNMLTICLGVWSFFKKNEHEPSLLTTQPTSKMTFILNKQQEVIPYRINIHRTKILATQSSFHQLFSNSCLTFVLKYWTKYSQDKNFCRKNFRYQGEFLSILSKRYITQSHIFIEKCNI